MTAKTTFKARHEIRGKYRIHGNSLLTQNTVIGSYILKY